jgi:hypothetical protein
MLKKIKKSKIIEILDTDYDELTCIIFYSSYMNINSNSNKMTLFFSKIFLNEGSFYILKKKYRKEDIQRFIEFDFSEIKQLYNRNNINIYCIRVDYNKNKIKFNNKEFNCKKECFFIEKQKQINEYKRVKSVSLNGHLNKKIFTPYFSIKMKYLVKELLDQIVKAI